MTLDDAVRAPGNADFSAALVAWQREHGRHDLPWQRDRDPYGIWVSEIMLQQTQVSAVIPYYERFMARFPAVQALAAASTDEVMQHWSGLGYYARARNLHRAACIVANELGGSFPRTAAELESLPGIGRSTAAAIAAFAFGARAAILDGNVKRVLARAFAVEGWPGEARVEARLWSLAETLLPARDVEAYTQGLMDLGSTVCTRASPRCGDCPVASRCAALASGAVTRYPAPRPAKARPHRKAVYLVAVRGDTVLLERRPASGIWGGLWCLPELPGTDLPAPEWLAGFGVARGVVALPPVEHGFTHYSLTMTPVLALAGEAAAPAEARWFPLDEALAAGLPAPVRKILSDVRTSPALKQMQDPV